MSTCLNDVRLTKDPYPLHLDRFLNGVLIFLLIYSVFSWFSHRFVIGHDGQKTQCLEGNHRWYLIDRGTHALNPGDLVAYRSDARMAPEFPQGTLVVKRVEAVSGDAVDLETQGLRIQGLMQSIRFPHRERLKDRAIPSGSRWIIPEGSVWVMGDHPRSFDSRYFGPIDERQIVGVAHALPF